MASFKEKYGEWAIVTGASSGIGVEFANQLATHGLNLVLVARRVENLIELGEKLKTTHGIKYKALKLDLTRQDFQHILYKEVEGLDIGLLVNNAGMNLEGKFYRADLERNVNMIRLNVEAPFILAYDFGKRFEEQGRGGIIFTASTSSFQPMPYFTHYAATKAYVLSLAESMNYEFKPKGIDVIALCPGPTESEMSKDMTAENTFFVMKAEPVVKLVLNNIGKRSYVVPGFGNKIGAMVGPRMPRTLARNAVGAALKRFLPGVNKK